MKIILKELDNLKCAKYVKEKFIGMPYFSNKISHDLDLSTGTFYTMVPKTVNSDYPVPDYYDFNTGGRIFPFYKEKGQVITRHINKAEDLMRQSTHEYIKSDPANCLCLEEFNAEPHFPYIIESKRKYYFIDNKMFYLIDNTLSLDEINGDFNSSIGYGFICITLNLPDRLNSLNIDPYKEMTEVAKDAIFKNINSFFIEIYDEESYLLWVSNNDTSFLGIIRKNLGN